MTIKTKAQMAAEFGWCPKTFRGKLKELAIEIKGRGVDPRWQKLIYETLWYPDGVLEADYEKYRLPEGWEE
ncbi:MAG: hypothetical protein AAFN92_14595 [Bacteroidota bacterium]